MKKELYYIGVSGEDSYVTQRSLTKKEAKLVKDIIDELQTTREGCWMEKLPTKKELEKILDEYETWKSSFDKSYFKDYILEEHLWSKFAYDVLTCKRKIKWEVQGYIRGRIGELIDMYKKIK